MKNIILLMSVLAIESNTYAGEKVGNGGIAMVCRNAANAITSARLLDLWEPESFQADQSNTKSVEAQLESAILKIEAFDSHTSGLIRQKLTAVQADILMTGKALPLTDDALPDYVTQPGCQFEQVARYGFVNEFNATKLRIYREIYESSQFSNSDRAALILHEVFYRIDRENNGDETSQRTRRLVAHLFSGQRLSSKIKIEIEWVVTRYSERDKSYPAFPGAKKIHQIMSSICQGCDELKIPLTISIDPIGGYTETGKGTCDYQVLLGQEVVAQGSGMARRMAFNRDWVRRTTFPEQVFTLKAGPTGITVRQKCVGNAQVNLSLNGRRFIEINKIPVGSVNPFSLHFVTGIETRLIQVQD